MPPAAARKKSDVPIVEQIQHALLDPARSLTEILPMADMVARKLGLREHQAWMALELVGYGPGDIVPAYRWATGRIEGYNPRLGWQGVIWTEKDAQFVANMSRVPIGTPIIEMERDSKNARGHFAFEYDAEHAARLSHSLNFPSQVRLAIPREFATRVVRAVRDRLTTWTIELEYAGILGERLNFSLQDRQRAEQAMTHYSIANANMNVGVMGDVSARDAATVTVASIGDRTKLGALRELAEQIVRHAETQPADPALAELRAPAVALQKEAAKSRPNRMRVGKLLASIRTICEGAAGNLVAGGILAALTKLVG